MALDSFMPVASRRTTWLAQQIHVKHRSIPIADTERDFITR
jgi:hypothetical protein